MNIVPRNPVGDIALKKIHVIGSGMSTVEILVVPSGPRRIEIVHCKVVSHDICAGGSVKDDWGRNPLEYVVLEQPIAAGSDLDTIRSGCMILSQEKVTVGD
jgi:hypothetical protein